MEQRGNQQCQMLRRLSRRRLKMACIFGNCNITDDLKHFFRLMGADRRTQGCKKRKAVERLQRQ